LDCDHPSLYFPNHNIATTSYITSRREIAPRLFYFFFNDTATTEIYTLSLTTLFRSVLDRDQGTPRSGLLGGDEFTGGFPGELGGERIGLCQGGRWVEGGAQGGREERRRGRRRQRGDPRSESARSSHGLPLRSCYMVVIDHSRKGTEIFGNGSENMR